MLVTCCIGNLSFVGKLEVFVIYLNGYCVFIVAEHRARLTLNNNLTKNYDTITLITSKWLKYFSPKLKYSVNEMLMYKNSLIFVFKSLMCLEVCQSGS